MNKNIKITAQILFLLFLIAGSVYIIREARKPIPYRATSGNMFGTLYHITYSSKEDFDLDIVRQMNKVDASLSMFNPKSTISLLNRNISKATDPMFRKVFTLSQQISEATDGAFDITVAPLVNAWGFGFKNKEDVTPNKIDSLLKLTGYRKVKLINNHLEKSNPDVMLDCSAIAKGYGSDVVADFLDSKSVKNYMIEIGGEIRTKGVNGEGRVWTVGIAKPNDDNKNVDNELETMIRLTDAGLATSGNYRNFYYKGGKKYAHTIDPHTGYPVQHSILSATVIAPSCAVADGYATSFMVMGLDKALKVLKQHKELKAFFIYTDGKGREQVKFSPQLKNDIVN